MLTTILEDIAAILWIVLGIVAVRRFRDLNRRLDAVLTECEEQAHKLREEDTP